MSGGPSPIWVFLDANVLLPQYLRTVLLDLAHAGLLVAHWSPEVLAEVRRNLVSAKFKVTPAKADALLATLARGFPAALVQNHARHRARFEGRVDAKDLHVATAAYHLSLPTQANKSVALVSNNLKDLPATAFEGTRVHVTRANEFLEGLLTDQPEAVTKTLLTTCHRLRQPRIGQEDLLHLLERNACKGFAAKLADAWGFDAA